MPKTEKGQDEREMRLNYRLYDLMKEYGIGSSRSDWPSNRLRKWLKIGGEKFSKYITFELPLDMIAKIKCFLAFRDKAFAPADKIEMGLLDRFKNDVFALPFLPKELMGPIEKLLPEIKENATVKEEDKPLPKKAKKQKEKKDDKYKLNQALKRLFEKYEIGTDGMSIPDFCRWLGISRSSLTNFLEQVFSVSDVNKIRFYLAFRDPAFAPISMRELQYLEEMKEKIDPLPFLSDELRKPIERSQFEYIEQAIDDEKFRWNKALMDLIQQYSIGMPGNMSMTEFCELINIHPTSIQENISFRTTINAISKIKLYLAFRDKAFVPTTSRELAMVRLFHSKVKPLPQLPKELKGPIDFSEFDIKEEQVEEKYELNMVLVRNIEKHGIGILPEKPLTGFCRDLSMSSTSVRGFMNRKLCLGSIKSGLARIKFYLAFKDPAFAPKDVKEREILKKWKDKIKPLPLIPLPVVETEEQEVAKFMGKIDEQKKKEPRKVKVEEPEKPVKQEEDEFKLNKILKSLFDDKYSQQMTMRDIARHLSIPRTSFREYIRGNRPILKPEHKIAIYLAFGHEVFAPSTAEEQKAYQQMKDKIFPLSEKDVVQPDKVKKQAESQVVKQTKKDKAEDKFALNRVLIQLMDQYKIGKGGPSKKQTLKKLSMHGQTFDRYVKMERPLRLTNKIKLYLGFRHEAFAPSNSEEEAIYNRLKGQIRLLSFVGQRDSKAPLEIEEIESPTEAEAAALNISELSQQVASCLANDPEFAAKLCELILGRSEFIAGIEKQLPARKQKPAEGRQVLPLAMPAAIEREPDGKIIPAKFVAETRKIFNQTIRRLQELRVMDNRQRSDIQDELEVTLRSLENELKDLWLNVRAVRKTRSAQAAQQVYETERDFIATFKNGSKQE